MAIQNITQTVQQAATLLAGMDWLDQETAKEIATMAEAVANIFMVVYYQAETGQATQVDFEEAMTTLRQALP
ncbi:type I toxin-antitoxin system ptaRNA1 family toxin [Providencia rettgeri]|nr:type I toxin-antitoxin system ptaRNA1 family toxin [Providencia rettgeri]